MSISAFQVLLLMTRWGHLFCQHPRFKYLLLVKRWRIDKACYDASLAKIVETFEVPIRTSRSASREPGAAVVFFNGKRKHVVG